MTLGRQQQVTVVIWIFVEHDHGVRGLGDYQRRAQITLFRFVTKDTAGLLRAFLNVGHSPRSPELLHSPISPASSTLLPSTLRRNSFPTLKNGTRLAATETNAPLLGLRPCRARRCLTTKLPKPRISIRSPWESASTMESNIALMITSESRRDRWGNRLFTSSIKSLLVI